MVSVEMLHRLLICDAEAGRLWWRERTPDMFTSAAICSRWNSRWAGEAALNCLNSSGGYHGSIGGRYFKAHRVIWAMHTGRWPDLLIDHINGVRTDNRIVNLREATDAQNSANGGKRPSRNPSSKYIGVVRVEERWEPIVRIGRVNHRCGRFDCEIEAARARDRMALELRGEFARLNFPQEARS